MDRFGSTPRQWRAQLMPVILLGILLLAVAWAYLLTRRPQAQIDTAAAIIARVRDEGLDAYWPQVQQQYFLATRDGRLVGWRAMERWRLQDGSYQGLDIRVLDGDGLWDTWVLARGATSGYRHGGTVYRTPVGAQFRLLTFSEFGDDEVGQEGVRGTAVAAGHYVPPGMLDLAMYLTARGGRTARFRLLWSPPPPRTPVPRFFVSTAEPYGQLAVRLERPHDLPTVEFEFHEDGRIRRIAEGLVTYSPASQEELLDVAPGAAMLIQDRRVWLWQRAPASPVAPLNFTAGDEGEDGEGDEDE